MEIRMKKYLRAFFHKENRTRVSKQRAKGKRVTNLSYVLPTTKRVITITLVNQLKVWSTAFVK